MQQQDYHLPVFSPIIIGWWPDIIRGLRQTDEILFRSKRTLGKPRELVPGGLVRELK